MIKANTVFFYLKNFFCSSNKIFLNLLKELKNARVLSIDKNHKSIILII